MHVLRIFKIFLYHKYVHVYSFATFVVLQLQTSSLLFNNEGMQTTVDVREMPGRPALA